MKDKYNTYKLLPMISALLLFNGCMPRQADGRYPKSVYSYHPFNKYYQKSLTIIPFRRDQTSPTQTKSHPPLPI